MKQTTIPKPEQSMTKRAISLFLHTGEGFVMHMNNGTTLCRSCVKADSAMVFGSLDEWSKDDKTAACFPDLFTKDMAGSSRCSRCARPFGVHVPPPPLSLAIRCMSGKTYTCGIINGVRTVSTLPN